MSHWEKPGATDEWYTPRWIFDALGCRFDLDVAAPDEGVETHVPASRAFSADSLALPWEGFVWMNPPFGGRNGLVPWLTKFFEHGDGICLTPDRTSAAWWQEAHACCDAAVAIRGKVKFERPDGTVGSAPSSGTTLFASGVRGAQILHRANIGAILK